MLTDNFSIQQYTDLYKQRLLNVWERSVLATHDFLSRRDFEEIKNFVAEINFHDLPVYCLITEDTVIGFIGVSDRNIEMLFIDPSYFNRGLGKQLLSFAIEELCANKVDVNEQNPGAIAFYKKFGFEIVERTEKDDQGRDYPLLRMRLPG